jgi:23S rRNA pseudouridine2605 synthase
MERIQKIIANRGYCSRRKAEELIKLGSVKVNGEVIRELGVKVSNKDKIEVNGIVLDNNLNYEYYLLYKPRGVVTTTSDDKGRKTVVDLINTDTRIYPVGRLDYDTTGVLLLTNDGILANGLMHPSKEIDKVYIAKVQGILSGYDIKRLRNGIMIDGVKTSRARVKLKSADKKKGTCLVEVTIHEGKNHQVKKMIEAVGKKVIKLKRERYAFFDLTGLRVGEYRKLSNKEIAVIYSMIK